MAFRRRILIGLTTLVVSGALSRAASRDSYLHLPIAFEEAGGDSGAKYVAHVAGGALAFDRAGNVRFPSEPASPHSVGLRLVGAAQTPRVRTLEPLEGKRHYLLGPNPEGWVTNVPLYGKLEYANVYPGVDLVYYGDQQHLEYDFVIAPYASWHGIRLSFEGIQESRIDADGELVLQTEAGRVRQHRPLVYQEIGGERRYIPGRYILRQDHQVAFEIGRYDIKRPLIIDPVLMYSTYLGGGGDDRAYGIAVDAAGCAYIVGETASSNFPRSSSPSSSLGNSDVFVTKLNAAGTAILYSTVIGGSDRDSGRAIAIDSTGNAHITGFTYSTNFPTTSGAFRTSTYGQEEAFVVKLNALGNGLIYSTYLGGHGSDFGTGIAVDAAGEVHVVGYTSSQDFPVTSVAVQRAFGGGSFDAFATKLNAYGSALVYSSYLGSTGTDVANGIALDSTGNAYITGQTDSTAFLSVGVPTTNKGGVDVFVTKLNSSGTPVYARYLGGRGTDYANAIAVDSMGNAYVAGTTSSEDFPVSSNACQPVKGAGFDGFVVKISPAGSDVLYATYLGGSGSDEVRGVAVDRQGNAFVAGWTNSLDFPQVSPIRSSPIGNADAFVAVLSNGGAVQYSSYIGGSNTDSAQAIAIDASGNVFVAGYTLSTDFWTGSSFVRGTLAGSVDAFVSKIHGSITSPVSVFGYVGGAPASSGVNAIFVLTSSDSNGPGDLSYTDLLFASGSNPDTTAGCYVRAYGAGTAFYLRDDYNVTWLGPLSLSGSLQNSRCMLTGAGAAAIVTSTTVQFTLPISFKPAFQGVSTIFSRAISIGGGDSGWQNMGGWTIPAVFATPKVAAVTPNSGTGSSATFSMTYSDTAGNNDLSYSDLLFTTGSTSSLSSACYVRIYRAGTQFFLRDDANTTWIGPLTSAGALENTQCRIIGPGANAWPVDANTIAYVLPFSFKAALVGTLSIFSRAVSVGGGDSGWVTIGTWRPNLAVAPPTVVSVTPNSGTGSSATFSMIYSDTAGNNDLSYSDLLFTTGSSSNLSSACYVRINRAGTQFFLRDDANTTWIGPLTSAGALENTQCRIIGPGANAWPVDANTIAYVLPFSFKAALVGTLSIFSRAVSVGGIDSGWVTVGTWRPNVAVAPPTVVSVTPNSGTGSNATFSMTYSDTAGNNDLSYSDLLFTTGSSSSLSSACYVRIYRAGTIFFLRDDANTTWIGPLTSVGALENTQCRIIGPGANAWPVNANTIAYVLPFSFKAALVGTLSIFSRAVSVGGVDSGWGTVGTWHL